MKLLRFHVDVVEFSKVLIEGSHRHVFGRCSRGDQAVYKMDLRFPVAIQRIEVNSCAADFNARAGDESA